MKVVILCGGLGTRLSEETNIKPKPMVEIGSQPILWHIMKIFDKYGYKDFILPLGYKGDYIKNYFINYKTINSDFEIDLGSGAIKSFKSSDEDWKINLIDTGKDTLTGGRLLRLKDSLNDTFMMTYGDGVSDVDIDKLLTFHKSHGKIATVTAVRPQARFGGLEIINNKVESFIEKPDNNISNESWINGGFFVFNKEIFDYLENDMTILEKSPLEKLSREGQLMSFQHNGFWQCMDTIRDKEYLNELVSKGSIPWL
jgi:glucose-1-phosphate cytidylyltransferase